MMQNRILDKTILHEYDFDNLYCGFNCILGGQVCKIVIYMYVCVCVCVYTYIYTHRHMCISVYVCD